MEKTSRLNSILAQIKKLDYETRVDLMERLARQMKTLKKKTTSKESKLSDLNSLGSEIWTGIDPDNYIRQQRQWD